MPVVEETKLGRDLTHLRDNVLRLGDLAARAVNDSISALKKLDSHLAMYVITNDAVINQLRFQIERDAYKIIAMQQPTARDMRAIIVAIHVAVELERIADHAAGISKLTIEIADSPLLKMPHELNYMSRIGQSMLKESLDAYIKWDTDLATKVFKRDDEVDKLYRKMHVDMVQLMETNSKMISCGTYYLWISNNLERIADRVTNICERIHFMVTGDVLEELDG